MSTEKKHIDINDEREVRLGKLHDLAEAGISGYPSQTGRTHTIKEALAEPLEASVTIAGRVMVKREIGKMIFCHIQDASGRMQVVLKQDDIGKDNFKLFAKKIDGGDFVECVGSRFQTKKGEESILVSEWRVLSKSLRPLPDKYHGLKDEEARLRKRYLDLLLDPDLRDLFMKKAAFWDVTRRFMKDRGFFGVETPLLETTTGGAEATPFSTHHNDFDLDVYLRISVGELWQKRLMAAGFEKTFEIGRVFRNEGSSPEHLQEFTNMEFYAAYLNFEDGKKMVQDLYRTLAHEVFGTTKFTTRGHSFDLADEWEELDYVSTVEKMTGVNVLEATEEKLKEKLDELNVTYEGDNRERMTDSLWKYCRKQVSGPAFLIHHPKLVAPLSKEHPTDSRLTQTFQVILAGSELGRAHAELNDPVDQQKRFEAQHSLIESGDTEAMMPDWEFVEMLEHGMPPTFGFGFGERLFAYFVDKPIRECVLFPLMKPHDGGKQ